MTHALPADVVARGRRLAAEPGAADRVRALLEAGGDQRLPSLTREELLALDDNPLLGRVDHATWAAELSDHDRALIRQTAQQSLVARQLLLPAYDDTDSLTVSADLRMILLARQFPSVLVILREHLPETADRPALGVEVRGIGIDLDLYDRAALILTTTLADIEMMRFTRPDLGVATMAEWLLREPEGQPGPRTVEVLHPAPGPGLSHIYTRLLVVSAQGRFARAMLDDDGQAGDPVGTDVAELAAHLSELILRTPEESRVDPTREGAAAQGRSAPEESRAG